MTRTHYQRPFHGERVQWMVNLKLDAVEASTDVEICPDANFL